MTPKKNLHLDRIKKEKEKWLKAFVKYGTVSNACRAIRKSRQAVYDWRNSDPEFAAAWAEAEKDAIEAMEKEADRRAIHGTRKPVYYQGKVVGHVIEYSDTLLMFRLKALQPDKYRENIKQDTTLYAPEGLNIIIGGEKK